LIPLRHLLLGRCADTTTVRNPPQHATVATNSPHPPLTGTVDDSLIVKQLERKRRLESTPSNPPRSPGRRPGHSKQHELEPCLLQVLIVSSIAQIPKRYPDPLDHQHRSLCPESARQPDRHQDRSLLSSLFQTPECRQRTQPTQLGRKNARHYYDQRHHYDGEPSRRSQPKPGRPSQRCRRPATPGHDVRLAKVRANSRRVSDYFSCYFSLQRCNASTLPISHASWCVPPRAPPLARHGTSTITATAVKCRDMAIHAPWTALGCPKRPALAEKRSIRASSSQQRG
jgi:hypothetical protein